MDDIVTLLLNTSVTVVVVAYFIFKDIKFNSNLQQILNSLNSTLTNLEKALDKIETKKKGE